MTDPTLSRRAEISSAIRSGMRDWKLSKEFGITRDHARRLIGEIERENGAANLPAEIDRHSAVALYEAACRALGAARTIVEVKDVADKASALKEYGRLAKDRQLEIDAAELRIRSERRLGEMLVDVKQTIGLNDGGRPRKTCADEEQVSEIPTLAEAGIDRKLSSRAQKLASISERAMEARLTAWRQQAERGDDRISVNILKGAPINGARAVMGSRIEPDDSLDFFPTPPWATRALFEYVFKTALNRDPHYWFNDRVVPWEPACGEGHISKVLMEYCPAVIASDIHDYGGNDIRDFFTCDPISCDWIITNPPFRGKDDRALAFALRALELAATGVALFVRTQWAVEGIERYNKLFCDRPPTLFAPFVERVPLRKGDWNPAGSTATAYCWLVWIKGQQSRPPFWIPPGCRERLTKPDDVKRFAAWSLEEDEAA